MIGIVYGLVFCFGVFQLIFFLFLALPMPKGFKNSFTRFLESPKGSKLQQWQKYALFLIIILFLNSVKYVHDSKGVDISEMRLLEKKEYHVKRLYNERNLYLTGCCLILTLAIVSYFLETRKYYKLKDPVEQELKNSGIKLDNILKGKNSLDAELQQMKTQKEQAKGEQVVK